MTNINSLNENEFQPMSNLAYSLPRHEAIQMVKTLRQEIKKPDINNMVKYQLIDLITEWHNL